MVDNSARAIKDRVSDGSRSQMFRTNLFVVRV